MRSPYIGSRARESPAKNEGALLTLATEFYFYQSFTAH